jgi:hypothetical protein
MTTEAPTRQIDSKPLANGSLADAAAADLRPIADETAGHEAEPATRPEPRPGHDVDRHGLYGMIKNELARDSLHDEEIQYELARWVELLETSKHELQLTRKERRQCPDEARQDHAKGDLLRRVLRKAGAAIPALISSKPELVFARTLRIRAEMCLLRRNGWSTRHLISATDGSPTMIVGLGTLLAAAVGTVGRLLWLWLQSKGHGTSLFPLDATLAPQVVSAAYLGGLVSILTRLQSFSKLRDFDPMFLFLNAFAKPFVGAVFGLFAYAAVKSGLVPLDPAVVDHASLYSLWAIGFLAGFSERFANDLVSRGEGFAAPKKS